MDPSERAAVAALLLHYVIHHRGTVYVAAQGLLGAAHLAGVRAIAVELLQAPTEANGHTAICAATVVTPGGRFRGLGDASPRNSRETTPSALLGLAQVAGQGADAVRRAQPGDGARRGRARVRPP